MSILDRGTCAVSTFEPTAVAALYSRTDLLVHFVMLLEVHGADTILRLSLALSRFSPCGAGIGGNRTMLFDIGAGPEEAGWSMNSKAEGRFGKPDGNDLSFSTQLIGVPPGAFHAIRGET